MGQPHSTANARSTVLGIDSNSVLDAIADSIASDSTDSDTSVGRDDSVSNGNDNALANDGKREASKSKGDKSKKGAKNQQPAKPVPLPGKNSLEPSLASLESSGLVGDIQTPKQTENAQPKRPQRLSPRTGRPLPPGGDGPRKHCDIDRRRAMVERLMLTSPPSTTATSIVKQVQANPALYASTRQIQEDMAIIRARWKEEASRDLAEIKGQTINRLFNNLKEYREMGAWTAHVATERLIAEICGLRQSGSSSHTTVQVASTGPTQVNVITDPEADAALARALLEAANRASKEQADQPVDVRLLTSGTDVGEDGGGRG